MTSKTAQARRIPGPTPQPATVPPIVTALGDMPHRVLLDRGWEPGLGDWYLYTGPGVWSR